MRLQLSRIAGCLPRLRSMRCMPERLLLRYRQLPAEIVSEKQRDVMQFETPFLSSGVEFLHISRRFYTHLRLHRRAEMGNNCSADFSCFKQGCGRLAHKLKLEKKLHFKCRYFFKTSRPKKMAVGMNPMLRLPRRTFTMEKPILPVN